LGVPFTTAGAGERRLSGGLQPLASPVTGEGE
jgi:hypothetical protein